MKIMDTTMKTLAASLNLRQMRNEVLSSNIANAETPGYKAKRLDFEQALQRAIDIDRTQTLKTSSYKHYRIGGGGDLSTLGPLLMMTLMEWYQRVEIQLIVTTKWHKWQIIK